MIDDNQIIEAYKSGMSAREVASLLGLNQKTVFNRLRKHGCTRSKSEYYRLRSINHARGYSLKPNGYIEYTTGEHKFRSVHRVIMESIIGRKLGRREVVHHIDGNRSNNDPSNLQLMTLGEHTGMHNSQRNRKQS